MKGLRREQINLQRLLHVEKQINLPNLPLLTYQMQLDKNLVDLREELHGRKLQIQQLLLQQESLCNVLEEPRRKLYEDPLSSAEDIEMFKENLAYLETLKIERQNLVMELRADIKKLSKELDIPILDEPGLRFVATQNSEKHLNSIIAKLFSLQPPDQCQYAIVAVQYQSIDAVESRSKSTKT